MRLHKSQKKYFSIRIYLCINLMQIFWFSNTTFIESVSYQSFLKMKKANKCNEIKTMSNDQFNVISYSVVNIIVIKFPLHCYNFHSVIAKHAGIDFNVIYPVLMC